MSWPKQHVVDITRRGHYWIARCTCGGGSVTRRLSHTLTRLSHADKPTEDAA